MKKLEFTTGKGEFILLDLPKFNKNVTDAYVTHIDYNLNNVNIQDIDTGEYVFGAEFAYSVEIIGSVKYMTEEQFAEVFDEPINHSRQGNYYSSYRQKFESLIKSLGWYLWENPLDSTKYLFGEGKDKNNFFVRLPKRKWQEAEYKTLYNPVLLKKL